MKTYVRKFLFSFKLIIFLKHLVNLAFKPSLLGFFIIFIFTYVNSYVRDVKNLSLREQVEQMI